VLDSKGLDCAANGEAAAGLDEAPNGEACDLTPLGSKGFDAEDVGGAAACDADGILPPPGMFVAKGFG